jgi:glycosyltransferase involved in cell wall biosynthesis
VWTQWPDLGSYANFWAASRWLRIPVVHTVHNILPHERIPGDMAMCETVYDTARLLFVHSTPVREELTALFPAHASKVVTMPHGTYTLYPRRSGARASVRAALNIPANAVVLLCCGLIRPYKNVDACIQALAGIEREDVILVIAGSETGASPLDPLAQTRALVRQVGVEDRVRFLPGFLDETAMAELFEATDVLMLPYLKSYGSGLLMLGITFGKYIVATRSGMEESASLYPGTIFLAGSSADDVRHGIELALQRVMAGPTSIPVPPGFDWTNIAGQCLNDIGQAVPHR